MTDEPARTQMYFVGVDGGGTKCRAVLMDSANQTLGTGVGGPANPYQNLPQALESITNAVDMAIHRAGLPAETRGNVVVGMGLAGVNIPSVYQTVSQWEHPFLDMVLTTDLHIACIAAHGKTDGAVIVTGTGSCGYANVAGESLMVGGHGFPCGDKGSGAWLGLSAIQAILLAEDNIGPPTSLTELVSEQLQARGVLIIERLSGAGQSDFAKFAPLVFHAAEHGDAVAINIVNEGAKYLNEVARKLLALKPIRISLIGGNAENILPWLAPEIAKQFEPSLHSPEFGAVLFAQKKLLLHTAPESDLPLT